MKILIKITSLTLLTFCLQANASYGPGAAGFASACKYIVDNGQSNNRAVKSQFSQAYGGIDVAVCLDNAGPLAITIQTFINTNFNPGTGLFNTAADAQAFATLVDTKSYLFTGNIFPLVGTQTYYQIATQQIEDEVRTQTSDATTRGTALQQIAASVAPVRGLAAALPVGNPTDIAALVTQVQNLDTAEIAARNYLNGLLMEWDATANTFNPAPLTAADLGIRNIERLIKTTFANRLQYLFPVANPAMPPLLTLIQDPATAPLTTNLLDPVTTAAPTDYDATETEAKAVIDAMVDEITATDAALNTVTLPAPAAGAPPVPTQLSAKATYILRHMTGAVVSAKAAVSTALNGVMALAGYTPAAVAPGAAAPVINEAQLATDAATAITATDAELVRVAGTLVPAFPLAATTLQTRATALLRHLSAGGGSASITAYLGANLNDTLFTQLSTATAPALSFIDQTRTNLGLAIQPNNLEANVTTGRKQLSRNSRINARNALKIAAFTAEKRSQLDAIVAGLNADATYATATTADAKVQAAITYLTGQLYQSYMWLQMTKELTSAVGVTPLTFAAVPGVPAFNAADTAQNVALATQNRITALIGAIKTLNTQNAALTGAAAAARGGAAGAETDASVVAVTTEIQRLAAQLTPCNAVATAATPAAKLPLLPAAVTQMVAALTNLSTGAVLPAAGAADGTALATAIRTAIQAANPAVAQLAAAQKALATAQTALTAEQAKVAQLNTQLATAKATGGNAAALQGQLAAAQTALAAEQQALATAQGQVAQLQTQLGTMVPQATVAGEVTRGQNTFAQALIDPTLNRTFNFDQLPATFNLANLTTDAPNAGSNFSQVGNYLRECAMAAEELKKLAGLTTTPATMQDLMTQSATAIRTQIAAAPAPAAPAAGGAGVGGAAAAGQAPAAGQAAEDLKLLAGLAAMPATMDQLITDSVTAIKTKLKINPTIIAGHNESVNAITKRFNDSGSITLRKGFLTLMSALNKAAVALNVLDRDPGVNALTITITNPDRTNIDIDATKDLPPMDYGLLTVPTQPAKTTPPTPPTPVNAQTSSWATTS